MAAVRATARCLPSTLTARVLRSCTVLRTAIDGAQSEAGLILSGNTLYGTASNGGSSGNGTVFAVNTDGTGFTTLHSFTDGNDGANPGAGLILSGNTLYGTASEGGSFGRWHGVRRQHQWHGFYDTCIVSRVRSDGADPQCRIDFIGQHPVWDGE